ncbi:MAG TPA: hypothetical protein PLX56_06710 [bacterium]|nr:hypothetical protein [bacterium]HQO92001.1 hypothetical protein [bacterium]
MLGKMKIFILMAAFLTVSFVYADQPWEGEEPYSTSEYCLLEDGNSVLGGVFTEFFNEETTGCLPFEEKTNDFIDFGETVYSLAGKGSVLAVGFYNRVEVYSIADYDDRHLLFSKTVYGPVYDMAIDGDILYLAVENGVSKINLETEAYFHKHTYGTTKALRIHNNKLYVGDGQGIKKMNLNTLNIEGQKNTSGDVTKLEIMGDVIYTFEWAGIKRFNLTTLAPISTSSWNPNNPELRAYGGTLYAFGNNSVQKVTFNGSSVVRATMAGDRVELRNNHTYDDVTFFPDGNGIRVSYLEKQYPKPDYDVSEEMTVIGEEKASPYSLSVMMAARDNLVADGTLHLGEVTDEDLAPTHYYVVFEPQNEDELWLLKEDEELFLTETPLHYEIAESGIYYRDPQLPDDQPNYQYAVVEVGKTLPNVQFFILDYLILEPEDEEYMTPFFLIYFPLLEVEAFQIKQEDFDKLTIPWKPSGKIEVWDDILNQYVPVTGVPVVVTIGPRHLLNYKLVVTDNNGDFELNGLSFFPIVEYEVHWVNLGDPNVGNKVAIRPGEEKADAKYRVVRNQQPFNWQIGDSSNKGRQWFYAHIFRALRNYLTLGHGKYGINPDFNKRIFHAYYTQGTSFFRQSDYNIRIYASQGTTVYSSAKLFSVVTHEIAHMHHEKFRTYRAVSNKWSWSKISDKIMEGWAIGVEMLFTYELYPDYIEDNYFYQKLFSLDNFYNFSNANVDMGEKYSTIVIDLLEGRYMPYHPTNTFNPFPVYPYNQRSWFDSDAQTHPNDYVFNLGINLRYIKDRIAPRRRFSSWKDDMESRHPGTGVKELFEQFESKKNVQWK